MNETQKVNSRFLAYLSSIIFQLEKDIADNLEIIEAINNHVPTLLANSIDSNKISALTSTGIDAKKLEISILEHLDHRRKVLSSHQEMLKDVNELYSNIANKINELPEIYSSEDFINVGILKLYISSIQQGRKKE